MALTFAHSVAMDCEKLDDKYSRAARRIGELVYLQQNEIFLPTADWVDGLEDGNRETVFDRRCGMIDWVVPIDDTDSYTFKMYAIYDFHHQPPSGMDGDVDRASDYIRARTWQGWIDDGHGGDAVADIGADRTL